ERGETGEGGVGGKRCGKNKCGTSGEPAMLTRLAGGRVIDPANGRDAVGDSFIRDGRIIDEPAGSAADETYNVSKKIVMAGAIDVHSHIAGNNETMGRLLLPEQRYPSDVFHPGHYPQPRG